MSNNKFFSIAGIATVQHTPETRKIWLSWPGQWRTHYSRYAIIEYAKSLGFEDDEQENIFQAATRAFEYLKSCYNGATKAFIVREVLTHYAANLDS